MEWSVGLGTVALALATAAMAWKTRDMAAAANSQASASRDQAQAARDQIALIETQLAEERAERDQRSREAADAYQIATETLRESIRSRLDAGIADVSIYATPSDLVVEEPGEDGLWQAVELEERLPLLGEHIADWRFRLHIDFTVMNRSGVAVHVNAPNPGPGRFDDQESNRFNFILDPGEDRTLTWRMEMNGRGWWRWSEEGLKTTPPPEHPRLVEFHFQVQQPLVRGVVQNHRLRASISPCVVRDGAIRQVHATAVNMRRLGAVELDYVGLRDFYAAGSGEADE